MASVEERLAYLEARLQTLEEDSSEGLTPNYLTYSPATGQVGAAFSGKISALGVDIPAGVANNPPATNRLRWIRQSDGAVVADLFAGQFSGGMNIAMRARAASLTVGEDTSDVIIAATDDTPQDQARIELSQGDRGAHAAIALQVGLQQRILFAQDGTSGFLQAGSNTSILSAIVAGTLTWPGASLLSTSQTIQTPGTGTIRGVGTCDALSNGAGAVVLRTASLGGGQLLIQGQQANSGAAAPAAGIAANFALLWWGT